MYIRVGLGVQAEPPKISLRKNIDQKNMKIDRKSIDKFPEKKKKSITENTIIVKNVKNICKTILKHLITP